MWKVEAKNLLLLLVINVGAFPRHPRLLKGYNEEKQDLQQKYLKKKLFSARIVTENAYGMLKGRWHIL